MPSRDNGICVYCSLEVGCPALNLGSVGIHHVQPLLRVFVLVFHCALIDLEEYMLVVAAPLRILLDGFVMSKLFRHLIRRCTGRVNTKDLEFLERVPVAPKPRPC